jgi:transposase
MLALPANAKIFLCPMPTNMRKSFEGLSSMVESLFQQAPANGAYFVFINRRKDSMKVLYWDSDGFALWYKRLEKGTFPSGKKAENLDRREFLMLLEGVIPKRMNKRFKMD